VSILASPSFSHTPLFILEVELHANRSEDEVISEARAIAGPPDAKTMVGVDFGGLKVVN